MIFTPKSIETQWVKRVNEYGIAKQVFLPSGHAPEHFRVALCEDGKSTGCTSQVSVRKNLEDLFRYWGEGTTVSVEVFSFISSTAENYELLLNCHMFYFGGIWGQVLADDFMLAIRNSPLVHVLKGRVQYNEIAYLAVCGAACISGCTHMYGAPGLDLLDGVHIEYSANISAGHATMETNAQTVQITTGTAAFLLMTPTQKQAASIVVIKNAWQWGPSLKKAPLHCKHSSITKHTHGLCTRIDCHLAATDIGTSICAANCVSMLTTSNILALMPMTSFPVRAIGVVS